jgi:hypothetical protein
MNIALKMTFKTLLAGLALSGCSTLVFTNGSRSTNSFDRGGWHHVGILRLVEFSEPIDLKRSCNEEDWEAIRVEQTFVNGLVRMVSSYGTGLALYDPWDYRISCAK